jgi:soluble lytic murein transglycosylase-like protein
MNFSGKLVLPCAFLLLLVVVAPSTLAQTTRAVYRFDNFDVANGVRVASPPVTDTLPAKRVRLTAKTSSATTNGKVLASVSEGVYTRPRDLAMTVSRSLDGFTTGDAKVDNFIVESGTRNGVDPVLLYAIMHRESAFKKHAVSYKGARGLMQLMPPTARRFGVTDIFDPRQNIEGGARYMRFLLNLFGGDVALSLAGYNAGEGAVLKYGRQVPPYSETREYVRRITQRYALMRDPQAARKAQKVTTSEVASIRSAAVKPSPVYERVVYSVRLPDGQLMLVSQ